MSRTTTKWCLHSRTLLFNCCALLATVLPMLEPALPQLQPLLPPSYYQWLALIVTVGNAYLRTITRSPVSLRHPQQSDSD